VTFGGVHTVRSLVAANLVDEYWRAQRSHHECGMMFSIEVTQ
jgi:hypothetical protein